MSWTTAADIRQRLQRLWDKGAILSEIVTPTGLFPCRLPLKAPAASDLLERFEAVREWSRQLRETAHVRVAMRDVRHRVLGSNAQPEEIWIDSIEDALSVLHKQRESRIFSDLLYVARAMEPGIIGWMSQYPIRALSLAAEWNSLLSTVAWLRDHPRPRIYVRQMDAVGVHSKFVQAHRGVLAEWLDILLPSAVVDVTAAGVAQFNRRFGFLDKPERIRFRILDPTRQWLPVSNMQDVTLDAASFSALGRRVSHVFVTENETNFLAFPAMADSAVIFGAGYGFDVLGGVPWLADCQLRYWGDIDTHGFAILDELRSHFPQTVSFLMDRNTLMEFESLWGEEDSPTRRELSRLDGFEKALYQDLRDDRIRPRLRLEQERIAYAYVLGALSGLGMRLV